MESTWLIQILTFLLLTVNLNFINALPEILRIGGLFEVGDDPMEMAFKSAVDRINSDGKLIPRSRLLAQVEKVEKSDSFSASKKACGLFEQGIAAIFGPQSVETSTHIQSTCDQLHIPHMETRLDFRSVAANHSINLHPHPKVFGEAIRDLIRMKNWKNFAILYQENEALVRLEEILKDEVLREKKMVVRQFETDEYRTIFKEVNKLNIKNLIVDVPRENIHEVLRHAQQVDMLSEYHDYIFTSLDLQTVDLEDFQYAGTNISSFCLIDRSSTDFKEIIREWQSSVPVTRTNWLEEDPFISRASLLQNFTTEVALMYDSVKLLAKALHDLDRSKTINMNALSCENEEPWQYGITLTNYMRMITVRGLTGDIKFDRNGLRTDVRLKLIELTNEGLKEVGEWTSEKRVQFIGNYSKTMEEILKATLKNKTLVVTTFPGRPYTMFVEDYEKKGLTGNDRFEGYCIDLMNEIAKRLQFKYVIRLVEDRAYGRRNEKGEWNGMIRELIDGKADIAVADLTITYERESAVDFTMPFMNLGIGILFRKPKKEPPRLFSFMSPLAIEVWIYLLTAFLGVTLFLFVIARFSPYEWINPHPCIKTPEDLENNFTMKNTLWFTIGCLMQQGCDVMPRALSTRVLAASWWFFILILVSSYTANLAAFLTVERMVNPIESVEDLAKQTKIHYGCLMSGSTQAFFKNSNFSTYARMWSFMESTRPSVFVESNDKGVERVKKGDYAYLMESTSIEYIVERECDLYQVGGLLDSKGYGIATPPDSPYRGIISDTILALQEKGILQAIKEKWWSQKKCGPKDGTQKAAGAASELGLANVGGVFVVLAIGSVCAVIICIFEFIWKMKQIPRGERDHIFVELMRELKHVICCYGSTRPVRRTGMDDMGSQIIMQTPGNGIPGMPIPGYGFPHPIHAHGDFIPAFGMGKEDYS
ncbi:glutamate receptor ionotropic, kainate 2 [Tetranychus urticae]|uniref:Glutamate receptor 1 n=1 Tax=Tetranychus urticae TaxID=32264 RepID=T1K7C7_TETUR|nr:glutamate receptor ionotropic, kainate 2 [Tetranychus urticae]